MRLRKRTLDLAAELVDLLDKLGVSAVNVVDIMHGRLSISDQASEHESGAGPNITGPHVSR